ncbi:extensin [Streptomyces sp. NPDC002209]|uniref:extensin n=1 Tax=Streptomyces sp. NPDC002209 TaxID=3364638 RepID=UPI0036C7DEAC
MADAPSVRQAVPVRGVPLHRPSLPGAHPTARRPLAVAPLGPPPAAAPPTLPAVSAVSAAGAPSGPAVQRLPSFGSGSRSGRTVGAVEPTVASAPVHVRPAPGPPPAPSPPPEPPPSYRPFAAHGAPPPGGGPAPGAAPAQEDPLPEYTAVPAGGFDPRELTDFQLDELVHRIIGRVTRLVRTELRMDRERIGRLRDPRA